MLLDLTEENREIIRIMTVDNEKTYNYNKALEECTEFSEIILKLQTKHETNTQRPHITKATKEFGDVVFRGVVALSTLHPEKSLDQIIKDVNEHINYKLGNLMHYYTENLYEGVL